MANEEKIHIEDDEPTETEARDDRVRTEEFRISGQELLKTVKELVREASARRIVVKNNDGRTLIEIPLGLGVAGIALLPAYSALALMAALVTECTILVERAGAQTDSPQDG
ncbi:MAG: DUF4342 domain-containing protein [Candidatus Promineifilaceae bacterium]|nr:DUF4342 domain-containing protein [Candidatus Promineifilaceae bacterium]